MEWRFRSHGCVEDTGRLAGHTAWDNPRGAPVLTKGPEIWRGAMGGGNVCEVEGSFRGP